MTHILSNKEIEKAVSMNEAIEAVREAYIDSAEGRACIPKRSIIEIPEHHGVTSFLPSYLARREVLGIKLASVYRNNPNAGLPLVHSVVVLLDGKTGKPMAFMDGRLLTAVKTGAATGVATDVLAKKNSRSLCLIGAGYQAAYQLGAVLEVRPKIEEISVFDFDRQKSKSFIERMQGTTMSGFPVKFISAETPDEAAEEKDIIITVTSSMTPVFDGRYVKEGAHINAVGSFTPDMQELDETIITRADKIVTDNRADALEMAGDLVVPMKKKQISDDIIYAELGEILTGRKPGRESDQEITLFESIGLSSLDMAVATTIYRNSLRYGIGHRMNLD